MWHIFLVMKKTLWMKKRQCHALPFMWQRKFIIGASVLHHSFNLDVLTLSFAKLYQPSFAVHVMSSCKGLQNFVHETLSAEFYLQNYVPKTLSMTLCPLSTGLLSIELRPCRFEQGIWRHSCTCTHPHSNGMRLLTFFKYVLGAMEAQLGGGENTQRICVFDGYLSSNF